MLWLRNKTRQIVIYFLIAELQDHSPGEVFQVSLLDWQTPAFLLCRHGTGPLQEYPRFSLSSFKEINPLDLGPPIYLI